MIKQKLVSCSVTLKTKTKTVYQPWYGKKLSSYQELWQETVINYIEKWNGNTAERKSYYDFTGDRISWDYTGYPSIATGWSTIIILQWVNQLKFKQNLFMCFTNVTSSSLVGLYTDKSVVVA